MKSLTIKLYSFTNGAWYFDNLFNYYISKPIINFGLYISYKLIDNQLLEFLGPTNLYNNMTTSSNKTSSLHSGRLSIYVLLLIVFIFFSIMKF
jgi:hypothetical protein